MARQTAFQPLSYPKEQFQEDVLNILLTLLNQARFAFYRSGGDQRLWSLLSSLQPVDDGNFADPDMMPKDLGLEFAHVADMDFVRTVLQVYDYGVLGLDDSSAPLLDDGEGAAAWASRTLYDLDRSEFLKEWSDYAGTAPAEAVGRCLRLLELANARLMLEGGTEGFYLGGQEPSRLTFPQLSLLSGMTEASLRTLASRGAGIRTVKEGSATFIEIADAKDWLAARGRYEPIRRISDRGATISFDRPFPSVDELQGAIFDRIDYLTHEIGKEALDQRLRETGIRFQKKAIIGQVLHEVRVRDLEDRALMEKLAHALEWEPERFALRAAEAVLAEKLNEIEKELKGAAQ